MNQIYEILLKQLQLLQERSKTTNDAAELAVLSQAMAAITNRVAEMMTYYGPRG